MSEFSEVLLVLGDESEDVFGALERASIPCFVLSRATLGDGIWTGVLGEDCLSEVGDELRDALAGSTLIRAMFAEDHCAQLEFLQDEVRACLGYNWDSDDGSIVVSGEHQAEIFVALSGIISGAAARTSTRALLAERPQTRDSAIEVFQKLCRALKLPDFGWCSFGYAEGDTGATPQSGPLWLERGADEVFFLRDAS